MEGDKGKKAAHPATCGQPQRESMENYRNTGQGLQTYPTRVLAQGLSTPATLLRHWPLLSQHPFLQICFIYVYSHVHIAFVCPERPKEGVYSLGAGFTGICEPLDVGAGIQTVALCSLQTHPSSSYCSVFLLCSLLPCVLVGRTSSGLLSESSSLRKQVLAEVDPLPTKGTKKMSMGFNHRPSRSTGYE